MDLIDSLLLAGILLAAGAALGWIARDLCARPATREDLFALDASLQAAIGRRQCEAPLAREQHRQLLERLANQDTGLRMIYELLAPNAKQAEPKRKARR